MLVYYYFRSHLASVDIVILLVAWRLYTDCMVCGSSVVVHIVHNDAIIVGITIIIVLRFLCLNWAFPQYKYF